MSEIKTGGLDQYGTEPFERQQFGTAGVEGVNYVVADPFGLYKAQRFPFPSFVDDLSYVAYFLQ